MTTIPKLTDEAVAMLPLESGRAELLEEIMSNAVLDRTAAPDAGGPPPSRRPSRWLVPVAAAAAVGGIAAASIWASGLLPDDRAESSFAASSLDLPQGQGLVLDAAGWTVDSLGSDGITFRKGDAGLEVTSYPADSYDSYVLDRTHIVDPPAPGTPVVVLGRAAQMWAYLPTDHTAIRDVEDGHWIELRGAGMGEAEYLEVLSKLRFASEEEFSASLPQGYVTGSERATTARRILAGITSVSGTGFPSGSSPSFAAGEASDRYQFGIEVAGAYACSWLESYDDALAHDQPDQAARAARVLGTSRDWPILDELNARGDYPEVVWDYAEQVTAGEVPEGYREGLGC